MIVSLSWLAIMDLYVGLRHSSVSRARPCDKDISATYWSLLARREFQSVELFRL